MASKEKWLAPLSTTEPNHIGIIKVRQDNKNSETFYVPIVQNGEEFDMTQDGITKVYFCTKFKPFNPVEQEATIVDAKKGIIKYTMNNYDMQKPGLQTAYFKFVDKDGNYQGATQSFTYMIIKSIEQECTDSETYIVRLEQLVDLYNQFFETNSQSWKEFVEANRDILESIDPGGMIMTELIDFRHSNMLNKTFDRIKDRGNFWDEYILKNTGLDTSFFSYIKDDVTRIQTAIDFAYNIGINKVNVTEKNLIFKGNEKKYINIPYSNFTLTFLDDAIIKQEEESKMNEGLVVVGSDGSKFVKADNVKVIGGNFYGAGVVGDSNYGMAVANNPLNPSEHCDNIDFEKNRFFGRFFANIIATNAGNVNFKGHYSDGGNLYREDGSVGGYGILTQSCKNVLIDDDCVFNSKDSDRHAIYISVDRSQEHWQSKNVKIGNVKIDWSRADAIKKTSMAINIRSVDTIEIDGAEIYAAPGSIMMKAADGDIKNVKIKNVKSTTRSVEGQRVSTVGVYGEGNIVDNISISDCSFDSKDQNIENIRFSNVKKLRMGNNQLSSTGKNSTGIIFENIDSAEIGTNNIYGGAESQADILFTGNIKNLILDKQNTVGFIETEKHNNIKQILNYVHKSPRTIGVNSDGTPSGITTTLVQRDILLLQAGGIPQGCKLYFTTKVNIESGLINLVFSYGDVVSWSIRSIDRQKNTIDINLYDKNGNNVNIGEKKVSFFVQVLN